MQSTLSVIIILILMINGEVSEYDHSQENVHKSDSDLKLSQCNHQEILAGWMGWDGMEGQKWIEIVKFGFLSPPISYSSSHLIMSFGLSDLMMI